MYKTANIGDKKYIDKRIVEEEVNSRRQGKITTNK